MSKTRAYLVMVLAGLLLGGCKERANQSKSVAESGSSVEDKPGVSRIVFIGQKQACECTRNRIEASWKALSNANSESPPIPVTRIQWDLEEKAAEQYTNLKPLMVVPGIYFLDEKGALIEMLQGEVSQEKIVGLLR